MKENLLAEVEVCTATGESESRIVEFGLDKADEFIPKLLQKASQCFTDHVRLAPNASDNTHRIYVLTDNDKPVRVTRDVSCQPLFKWHGIFFNYGLDRKDFHKMKVQIVESNAGQESSEPSTSFATSGVFGTDHMQTTTGSRVEQPSPAAVESDSDESIELIPVTAKKQGITVLKQGNVIIKNWERDKIWNFKMANRSITLLSVL